METTKYIRCMLQPLVNILKKKCSFIALITVLFFPSVAVSQYANVENDSLLILGNEVYRKGNYPEAEDIYRKALDKYQNNKDSKEWVIAAVGYGASLLDQGNNKKGSEWIFKADSVLNNKIPFELKAYVKSNVGWAYKRLRNFEKSSLNYKAALDLAKESGDQYRIAQVSNSLSYLTYDLGNYNEAIKYGRIAVESFESINDLFLLSISYDNLSRAYEVLGFTDLAEKYLLKSFATKQEIQNNDFISTSHYHLGSFYHRTGNYNKALANYSKYLSYVKEVGDVPFITPAYTFVASVYQSLGEFENALEYYNESVRLADLNNIGISVKTRLNIAFCYQKLQELGLARSLYNKILSEQIKNDNTFDAIEIYLRFAELEHETGNYTEALSYAEKASDLSQGTESKQLKAKSYASLSKAHLALNNTALALNYSKRAYQIASVFKGYRLASYTGLLAKAFYQAQSDSAFYYADLAFAEIEREQSSVYGENLESGVFSNYADFYNEVAYWYLEQKNDVYKAFEITERGRARVLLERLSFSESDLQNVVEDTTLIALRQKEKNIDKLYRQIENSKDEQSISKLKSELSELEFQYQSFTNELHLKYPKLRSFKELETIKISEIQNSLSAEDALIEYMFTDHRLIIFRITKDDADHTSVEIDTVSPKKHLSVLVSDFRTAIQEKAALDLIGKRSKPLFELLLKPVSDKLDGINNLLIVPSKSLSLLPFDALYINNSFLIEKFSIKYLPSSTIYKYIEPPHRTTSRELFAVAGSGLNGSTSQTKNYSSLPSTILEVDAISKEFTDVLSLKHQEVSESKIKTTSLNEFRYLHFATHGNVNELNPQQSGLIISELVESEGAFQEDGYLNSKEISTLTFNADLVVLSACNTAVGKIISGEGLQGLQRSFLKAGASSVVVSLWSVYDKSTASFMGSFYKNLRTLEEEEVGLWTKFKMYFDLYTPPMFGYKEKALHLAKKELIQHPYYNHPVYWAPFVMIGK